ncbi:MAG: SDR family oxidoreductase [Chitinivorax sp.]|jgi:3-oxoacyl-[acyl-carrier protein] reductase
MLMLVTGASRGIGAAITEAAAKMGHDVIAVGRNQAALAQQWQAFANIRCEAIDVARADEWERLLARLEQGGQHIDVLINVAGVLHSGPTGQMVPQQVDEMIDVNVKGTIFGCNAVAPYMIRRGRGHIINIGSTASLFATPGTTVYATSKFAVRGFSIAAAGDLRPHGVAVSLVGPAAVKTDMLDKQRGDQNAALTFTGKRALTPEEVAAAVLGPVLKKRPLEYFLPASDGWLGKLCNLLPGVFLSQLAAARKRGQQNFGSDAF